MPRFISDQEMATLETNAQPKKKFISDEEMAGLEKKEPPVGASEAVLTGAQQALTLGHVPQIQGFLGSAIGNPSEVVDKKLEAQGFKISQPGSDYLTERDASLGRINKIKSEQPGAYIGGELAGALLTAPLLPTGAATVGGRLGQAAKTGAVVGGLQNPGDQAGVIDPFQAKDRAMGAGAGAALGAAAQGIGETVGGVVKGLRKIGKEAEKVSDSLALKQVGANKTDFKRLYKKDKIEDMGKFIRESGLIKGAPDAETVLERTTTLNKQAGQKIGDIYKTLQKNAPKIDSEKLADAVANRINKSGTKPSLQSDAIAFQGKMDTLIADIRSLGEKLSDPKAVNDLIGELDKKINYSLISKEPPAVQQGYYSARDALRTHLKSVTRGVGKSLGNKGLLKEYKAANDAYGKTKQIISMAENKAAANATNRMFSLTDYKSGLGGALLGAGYGVASGDPADAVTNGLLLGATGALGNKLARRVGPGLLSKAGAGAGKLADKLKLIEGLGTQGAALKGLLAPTLLTGE